MCVCDKYKQTNKIKNRENFYYVRSTSISIPCCSIVFVNVIRKQLENIFLSLDRKEEQQQNKKHVSEERELICKKEVDFLGINEVKKQFLIIWQNGNISKTLK